jgi:hypothetical protein
MGYQIVAPGVWQTEPSLNCSVVVSAFVF